jgi:hypothetical protein
MNIELRNKLLSYSEPEGFPCAIPTHLPPHMLDYMAEMRLARIENRSVAAFAYREYAVACDRLHPNASRVARRPISRVQEGLNELRRLSRATGLSFEAIIDARAMAKSSGRNLDDLLNTLKMQQVTKTLQRAKELQADDDEDDPNKDGDGIGEDARSVRAHERATDQHRCIASKSALARAEKHYQASDAHGFAAANFTPHNSRAARRASRAANKLEN